ncbi:MAG: DUF6625 family protein [Bacteroidales bacterium]
MRDIAFIVPYFGKLPSYFQLFLNSIAQSKIVDILLFTDDNTSYNYPSNVKAFYIKFEDMADLFKSKLGKVYLKHPYKFCEYKPTYGYIYSEYLKPYKYWGHCDLDIIFGDIDRYLIELDYCKYDRIFELGHLSIYKNTKEINQIFLRENDNKYPRMFNFKYVSKTSYPCHFDEIGVNYLFLENNLSVYKGNICVNNHLGYPGLSLSSKNNSLFVYVDGKLIIHTNDDGKIVSREYGYLHLQGLGNMKVNCSLDSNSFLIKGDTFLTYSCDLAFEKSFTLDQLREYNDLLKKKSRNSSINRLYREIKSFPIRFIYNLKLRVDMISYLKKNNLF